ncbi:hypothetical protein C1H76_8514 [Elsinoe australis]|uniref:Uncharacterized protein n=1 Tax=Elsinoe australis TaxID=40998 RepID=A0A4U7AMM2_9PEZI|nr:hypothetical protein C1H76_8514 [Elsinoe australis]
MEKRLPQMMRRAHHYTSLEQLGADKEATAWYWKVLAGISAWLIVGGFLMLPATFDTSDGFKVSKTAISALSITLVAVGICLTILLHLLVHNWIFRAEAILLPAFSSCLIGLLTTLYSFLVQSRYTWNLAAILTTAFSAALTITYGVFLFYTQRRIAACKGLSKPHHIPLRSHTSYEDARTAYEPSIVSQPPLPQQPTTPSDPIPEPRDPEHVFYNNYLTNMYPMLRSPSNAAAPGPSSPPPVTSPPMACPPPAAPQTPNTPWDAQSVVSERPPPPPINRPPLDASMLTEEELTRQQMLMLLLNRPEPSRPVDPSGQPLREETSYRIDWNGEEAQTPISGPGQGHIRQPSQRHQLPATPVASAPPAAVGADAITPHRPPRHTHTRSTSSSKALEAGMGGDPPPGVPPPYERGQWDGVWRSAADIPQERLHPAFRESRFMRTGGAREERRREIERGLNGGQ